MAALRAAFGSGAATNPIEDFRHADVIMVIGSNTTEQHPLVAERIIDAKKNKGAKLLVVDPRRTTLAKMADIYVPIQPGTDLQFINLLCRIIVEEGLHNQSFIAERTEGFEDLKKTLLTEPMPDTQNLFGTEEEAIREFARLYARGKNSSIAYCMGITQHATGTANCLSLCNLVMLCGMIGRPYTGLNPLRGQNNVQGSCDMGALPEVLTSYVPATDTTAWDKFSKVWGPYANEVGLGLTEIFPALDTGEIKALYIVGENPAVSDPNAKHAVESLRKAEFLVVQDIFHTDTTRLAHLVLPATSWLEKNGTFTNTERRVQHVRQILTPLKGTLPDWKIITCIMQSMGHDVSYTSPEDIFNEMRTLTPSYAGITYSRIEAEQGVCWPCPDETHPGTSILHVNTFIRGKGLFSPLASTSNYEQTDEDFPFMLTTGRVGFHYHTGTMTRRSWYLDREFPENFLQIHPEDAKNFKIRENQRIKVSSRRGSVVALARINNDIRQGVLFMPFHFAESAANFLTDTRLDPVTKIAAVKTSAVNIEKL